MSITPKSEILNTTGLVDYSEGSIVSRLIVKAEAGNVTLFAFDKGEQLSEHTAPYDALVHILEGEAEIRISGKPFQLTTGNSIIMPANEPHAVVAVTQFKMMLTMIRK